MRKLLRLTLQLFCAAGLGWQRGILKAQAEAGIKAYLPPSDGLRDALSTRITDMLPTSRWIN